MRKQAKQLVVGRVYADIKEGKSTAFLRLEKYDSVGDPMFSHVGGKPYSFPTDEGLFAFSESTDFYELTLEEDAIYNKPSEPIFTLSDIQRVIERIEKYTSDSRDPLIVTGMFRAIEIMREELKLK